MNCEWLVRPQVALSEMAETVAKNLPMIERRLAKYNTRELCKPIEKIYQISHTRRRAIFRQSRAVGYSILSDYHAEEMARVLTSDYNTYAPKINMSDGSDRMFKTGPSLKTLQEFWTAHVTQNNEMPNKTTTYKRNLLKGLDDFDQSTSSESSSDEQEIKKPTEKKATSTHSQMTEKTKIHQNLLLKLKKERGKEK